MNDWTTGLLLGVIALALALTFVVVWLRDKERSDEEASDPERLDTETEEGQRDEVQTDDEVVQPPPSERWRDAPR